MFCLFNAKIRKIEHIKYMYHSKKKKKLCIFAHMKYFNKLGALLLFLGTLSCQAQDKGYESLTVEAFCQTIADTTVVRLDVRTAAEFAEGHIERAVNIDVLSPHFLQDALAKLPQHKLIAINCRSGKRSKKAADILIRNGFKVVELDKGFLGWVAEGKKVVK